ncbi:YrrS family protein [Lentibacillus amyloliquefaciens]|uniref:DUF1510 domain-containing protein n=1 Tax=Lentibacillus amyloliquefaciens TaxID=1472767 RepID=A0A0U4FHP9_9BACI|nr:YrrS family protein [Lentibacillus amyloliquefaciens]ALX48158.1 hypothetical protein AOX59_05790 [Lentibacillus amyloliquefaciens]
MSASRVNKYEKRRKNTKLISILGTTGSILALVLAGMLIFGGNEEANVASDTETDESSQEEAGIERDEKENTAENNADDQSNTNDNSEANDLEEENSDVNIQQTEPSDDNVSEAYTGDWEAVGTEQTEPHTVNYSDGSQDREELRKAVAAATGLDEESFTMWYVERNGDQRVINTVSSSDGSEIYRVYNTWVPSEGWQPTKVEELIENDQKWRFE